MMDSTTKDNDSQAGGVAWELQSAWDLIVAARMAGDYEQEALGWRRYSEGLKNSAIGAAGGVLIPLSGKLDYLTRVFEHARQIDLDWRTNERILREDATDHIAAEIGQLSAEVKEAVRGLGKMRVELGSLTDRVAALETTSADLTATVAARPDQRAAEYQAIVDEFAHRFDTIETVFTRLSAALILFEDAVVMIDHRQCITGTNQEALDMFGYTSEDLIGEPIDMLIPERYRAAHRAHILRFAKSSEQTRRMAERQAIAGLHKNGTEFAIKVAIAKIPDGYTAVVRRTDGS